MAIAIITDINKKIVKNIRGKDIYCYKIKLTNWFEWVLVQKKDNKISTWQKIEYRKNNLNEKIIEPIKRHERHIVNSIIGKGKELTKRQLRWKKELHERTLKNIITLFGWMIRVILFINLLYLFIINEFVLWIVPQEYIIEWKIINILTLIWIAVIIYKSVISTEEILNSKDLYTKHYEDKFLKEFE